MMTEAKTRNNIMPMVPKLFDPVEHWQGCLPLNFAQ